MVKPKYSPTEALNRIKLMMEYDSSRTYTENKEVVESKQQINEALPAVLLNPWVWGSVAAALGLGGGALASEYSSQDSEDKLKALASGCDKTGVEAEKLKRETMSTVEQTKVAGLFRKAFDWTLFGFGVGAGTDLQLIRQALEILETKGNFGDFCKVREIRGKSAFDNELIDELNTSEIGEVVSVIEILLAKSAKGNIPAKDESTKNVNWWLESYPCLVRTDSFAENPIVVHTDKYGNSYVVVNFKVKGVVKQFHVLQDGAIYTSQHKATGKKLECEGTKVGVIDESIKKNKISEQADLGNIELDAIDSQLDSQDSTTPPPSDNRPSPTRRVPTYKTCQSFYRQGCKSDAILKVQGCLGGIAQDGKFGPETLKKLNEKFPELNGVFRDSEVDKICKKVVVDTDVEDYIEDPNKL